MISGTAQTLRFLNHSRYQLIETQMQHMWLSSLAIGVLLRSTEALTEPEVNIVGGSGR